MWNRLEEDESHLEACRVENKIKNNRRILSIIDQENLRHQFKVYDVQVKLSSRQKNKAKLAKTGKKPERKVKQLEERLKRAIDKSYELNTWGLNDAIMTTTLKVRVMENLLDCA